MIVNNIDQDTKQAVGRLVLEALAKCTDLASGYEFVSDNLTIDGVDIGGWRLEVRRTRKP